MVKGLDFDCLFLLSYAQGRASLPLYRKSCFFRSIGLYYLASQCNLSCPMDFRSLALRSDEWHLVSRQQFLTVLHGVICTLRRCTTLNAGLSQRESPICRNRWTIRNALALSDELESLDGHHQYVLSLRSLEAGTCEVPRRPREPDELPIRHGPDRS